MIQGRIWVTERFLTIEPEKDTKIGYKERPYMARLKENEELELIRLKNLERLRLERKEALSNNKTVKKAIPRLDSGITKEIKKGLGGRKKRYTPTKMKNEINKYFEYCETEDCIPSIKGMMIHLKMYRDQFYTYCTYPEFRDMMEQARLHIANWIEEDIYTTPGMAAGKIKYAQNVLDWADKSETVNTTTQTVITVDQARAKIEMLAPKLLELLKSNTVVNQLTERPDDKKDSVLEAELVKKSARRI
jgi:hypothetical protein